jgi:hypothetical protein
MKNHPIYGLLAEFERPEELLAAAHKAHEAGYRRLDAFSPLPIEGLSEALGFHGTKLPMIVMVGGCFGAVFGFGMQYFAAVINYPWNVGGKPLNSWPAFIPITFEVTIAFAAISTVLGMLALNGLPTPYHPVFNVPRFAMASRDRFFLCVKSRDAKFDVVKTRQFLESLKARGVFEIEA